MFTIDKNNIAQPFDGLLFSHKKNDIGYNMTEPGKYFAQ